MGLDDKLRKEKMRELYEFFKSNLPKLINRHLWKYVLIGEEKIFEFYDASETASREGVRRYGLEKPFLIQQIEPYPPTNFVFNAIV
jgi:hypothetical protein